MIQPDNEPPTTLSGRQVSLRHGDYAASIATVGASLRELSWHGRPLVRPWSADGLRPVYSGSVLAPWPNRVIDGAYDWEGEPRQLALSEPARGHALHGLLAWSEFEIAQRTASTVRLRSVIEAQEGYPHRVLVELEYVLGDKGLETTARAELLAGGPAPFGWGTHPYLCAPGGSADAWSLTLAADTVQLSEGERLLPSELVPVERGAFDFRAPRSLRGAFIDHAFTGLERDDAGLAHVEVLDAEGVGVRMSWGRELGWVQIHTADRPEPELDRTGLAVEPMTCPPGAFNSGTDVIRLEHGTPHEAAWVIQAVG